MSGGMCGPPPAPPTSAIWQWDQQYNMTSCCRRLSLLGRAPAGTFCVLKNALLSAPNLLPVFVAQPDSSESGSNWQSHHNLHLVIIPIGWETLISAIILLTTAVNLWLLSETSLVDLVLHLILLALNLNHNLSQCMCELLAQENLLPKVLSCSCAAKCLKNGIPSSS